MELPNDYLEKMERLLKEEYKEFIKSYADTKVQGLRVNTLKVSVDHFWEHSSFHLNKIPWVKNGFFYAEGDQPGKHPYHEAGLYYIQEPSAMAVAEILDAKPGEKVLDLCAAPGGKTTHIASALEQQGLLVANEIHPTRAKILSQNVERMGIKNAVVTNEAPNRLAKRFPVFFDRILVDAPCSGEGMFRKNPEACLEWSIENVAACAMRQKDILEHADTMLRLGGRLVYSTCTFSPEENEGVIDKFLKENPNYEIESVEVFEGFGHGRVDWVEGGVADLQHTIRIWPHQVRGEGHFIAVLRKTDGEEQPKRKYAAIVKNEKQLKEFFQFAEEFLTATPSGNFVLFGEELYLLPNEMLTMDKLQVIRPGWHLGTLKKNRFEPSHALALGLNRDQVKQRWNLDAGADDIVAYLKGETLRVDGEWQKGWYLVEVDGYSIGWGKLANNQLKNHFPKGLRWKGNVT